MSLDHWNLRNNFSINQLSKDPGCPQTRHRVIKLSDQRQFYLNNVRMSGFFLMVVKIMITDMLYFTVSF